MAMKIGNIRWEKEDDTTAWIAYVEDLMIAEIVKYGENKYQVQPINHEFLFNKRILEFFYSLKSAKGHVELRIVRAGR